MNDRNPTEPTLDSFADLPIQPTGSGVTDLEIAYEQMKLSQAAEPSDTVAHGATTAGTIPDTDSAPVEISDDTVESAAHPS